MRPSSERSRPPVGADPERKKLRYLRVETDSRQLAPVHPGELLVSLRQRLPVARIDGVGSDTGVPQRRVREDEYDDVVKLGNAVHLILNRDLL